MAARAGIIGMGGVGSSVANSLLQCGVASELLLADAKPGLAAVEDMVDLDAVVVAAGRGGRRDRKSAEVLRAAYGAATS